jgi:hypothetical protein
MQNDVNCIGALENKQTQFLKHRFSTTNASMLPARRVERVERVELENKATD